MKLSKKSERPRVRFDLKRPAGQGDIPVFIEAMPIGFTNRAKVLFPKNMDGVNKTVVAGPGGNTVTIDEDDPVLNEMLAKRDNRIKITVINRAISWHDEQGFSVSAEEILTAKTQAVREELADRCLQEAEDNGILQGDIDDLWIAIGTLSNELDFWPTVGGSFLPIREPLKEDGSQSDTDTNS